MLTKAQFYCEAGVSSEVNAMSVLLVLDPQDQQSRLDQCE